MKTYTTALLAFVFVFAGVSVANADTINVGNETDLHNAMTSASNGDTVMMTADIDTTKQVTVSKEITLDGDGFTLSPQFSETDNSNNTAIGIIDTDNVTVQNLTIDGSGGTDLHGINVYVSDNVAVTNVSSNHNRSGLVVNGSDVTATDFSTTGNIWHGINVAQGGGVTSPAVLTIHDTSSHGEESPTSVPHIFIDDITQDATVNDVDNQYWSTESSFDNGTARAYTLNPFGEILEPEVDEIVTGETDLVATYEDHEGTNDEGVHWAVREGTCDVNDAATVAGNVAGFNDPYTWDGNNFDASIDTSGYTPGMYCFIFNPQEEGPDQPDVRETREFFVADSYVEGGGQIIEEMGNKKKDWLKVSFGGWAADVGELMGEWQINFHNVDEDESKGWDVSDKSKFHTTEITNITQHPGSSCDAIGIYADGMLDHQPGYSMRVYVSDSDGFTNAHPDTLRITLFDSSNNVVFESSDTINGSFSSVEDDDCPGVRRTPIDNGNMSVDLQ